MPYSSYEQFDFNVPVGSVGDNYDRFKVRLTEMRESLKIVEQALDGLPRPRITTDRKGRLPPRHELATSMEALIHHFKLVTEGFRVPPGEAYSAIERRAASPAASCRGRPSRLARVHMRSSPWNSRRCPTRCATRFAGHDRRHRDARLDPRRRGTAEGRGRDPRVGAATRWDDPARLDEPPATVPDPADVAPSLPRQEIEAYMARYPERHSAALRRSARHVEGTAGAHPRRSPRSPLSCRSRRRTCRRSRRSTTCCARSPRAAATCTSAMSVACHLSDAKGVYDAIAAEAREQGLADVEVREFFECLGACDLALMVLIDGRYVGPLTKDDAGELVRALTTAATRSRGAGSETRTDGRDARSSSTSTSPGSRASTSTSAWAATPRSGRRCSR